MSGLLPQSKYDLIFLSLPACHLQSWHELQCDVCASRAEEYLAFPMHADHGVSLVLSVMIVGPALQELRNVRAAVIVTWDNHYLPSLLLKLTYISDLAMEGSCIMVYDTPLAHSVFLGNIAEVFWKEHSPSPESWTPAPGCCRLTWGHANCIPLKVWEKQPTQRLGSSESHLAR